MLVGHLSVTSGLPVVHWPLALWDMTEVYYVFPSQQLAAWEATLKYGDHCQDPQKEDKFVF